MSKLICVKGINKESYHYFDREEKAAIEKSGEFGKEGAIVHVMKLKEYPQIPTKQNLEKSHFVCPHCEKEITTATIVVERL